MASRAVSSSTEEATHGTQNRRPGGTTVVIAEAETASGHVSGDVLDAVADMASRLPH